MKKNNTPQIKDVVKKKNIDKKRILKIIYIFFSIFLSFLYVVIILFCVFFSIIVSDYNSNLPSVINAVKNNKSENTQIYSRNGTLIDTIYGNVNRQFVSYNNISPYMIKSMIAAEDVHFFSDTLGINIPSILRSLYNDVLKRQNGVQGASTITQQLVKNTLLSNNRSVENKIKEVLLSIRLSQQYSKQKILDSYLNYVSFGGNISGIESASETYFGIPASKLNLAQSALLAGMVQAPSIYSPFFGTDPKLGLQRQAYVFNEIKKHDNILNIPLSVINKAQSTKLVYYKRPKSKLIDPWFIYYTKQYLINKYGNSFINNGGYKVYTTLSLKLQKIAQQSVVSNVSRFLQEGLNTHNSSLVSINPKNGHILAMVGSVNYNIDNSYVKGEVNSTLSLISPGSSLKPFVYLTGFRNAGLTPNSIVYDTPLTIGNWSPTDWNNAYEGPISIASALLQSRNIPAVRVGLEVGLPAIFSTFRQVGLSQFTQSKIAVCGYPAIIGGCDITTLQEAGAYASLANYGTYISPSPILKIYNRNNKLILNNTNPKGINVFQKKYTEMVISIIKSYYTMYPLFDRGFSVAGKTGTSNNHIDNVFAGFSPNLVAVVWSGNDNYSFTSNNTWGETTAALIWNDYMLSALKYYPNTKFNLSLWPYNYGSQTIL